MISLCLIQLSSPFRAVKSDITFTLMWLMIHSINLTVLLLFGRFFPIMSADNEKVGELQVSLVLESLMGMSFISFPF